MTKTKYILPLQIILISFIMLFIMRSGNLFMDNTFYTGTFYLSTVNIQVENEEAKSVTLPYTLELPARTKVIVSDFITPGLNDVIYIKTVYAPVKIYLDNELVYEMGNINNYPSYMKDPAVESYFLNPGVVDKVVELRMEFLSPITRPLVINPPIIGNYKAIFNFLLNINIWSFLFSVIQIVAGTSLIIIFLFVSALVKKAEPIFLYLGLFSLFAGFWSFGEGDFSGLIIKRPAFLYALTFIGFFTLVIPLLQFALEMIEYHNPIPLQFLVYFHFILTIVACVLQFTGFVSFYQSINIFLFTIPISICILTGITAYESIVYSNIRAQRFVIPLSIIIFSAFIEIINYKLKFTLYFSSYAQIGFLLSTLYMGIAMGMYIQELLDIRQKASLLEYERSTLEIQLNEHRKYNSLISESKAELQKLRHDLRHQLIVIKEMATNNYEGLEDFISCSINNIPSAEIKEYCENTGVNFIVSYYASLCENNGISLLSNLTVPEVDNLQLTNDLCVILGNMLENAIDACKQMEDGHKFITINSKLHHKTLVITMDNSFDGNYIVENGRARSSKRNGFGIGLSSIKSLAQKYNGNVEFKKQEDVFLSSVLLELP